MSNKIKSIVSRRNGDDGCLLTNGNKNVHISEIVIYDENGPLITNYTNCNAFRFELLKYVSTSVKSTPDWSDPAGFIMLDTESSTSKLINLFQRSKAYWLCLHIDNTRPYVRELIQYWELYEVNGPGAIQTSFSLEGCSFNRIVCNPEMEYAAQGIKDVLKPYDDQCTVFNNHVYALHNITELIEACDHIKKEALSYQRTARRISESMGIIELIYANGANGPINHNDLYDISRYKAFKYSYRIENA